ncbi:MAG: DUF799 family lipoprotein [Deltaproteobacteria bacterium]|nr:DUF799 family lipoprotein [Deltaproteobacteria bacterium]
MRLKNYIRLVPLLCVAFVVSCAPVIKTRPNPSNPVRTIAVLPMYNATNDVDGPQMIRRMTFESIEGLHYDAMPLGELDVKLSDSFGVTIGSQLDLLDPIALGDGLGVDALLYGYLLDFDTVTTGLYNVKKVRAGFKLIDAKTGRLIWANGRGVRSEVISEGAAGRAVATLAAPSNNLDDFKTIKGIEAIPGLNEWKLITKHEKKAGDAAILSLGERLITTAVGAHLKMESSELLEAILAGFPAGPVVTKPSKRK